MLAWGSFNSFLGELHCQLRLLTHFITLYTTRREIQTHIQINHKTISLTKTEIYHLLYTVQHEKSTTKETTEKSKVKLCRNLLFI